MQIRNLGKSGLRVSVVGLGCNNFGQRLDVEGAKPVIHRALDIGITLFDTADVYGNQGGSETVMGQILGDRRKDIVLATKFGMQMDSAGVKIGASRRYIMSAVEDSLRRLKTDWIDLYQLHRPDPLTPIEETIAALDALIRQGKVRYIGCSNMPGWQVVQSLWVAKELGSSAFVSYQDEYSLVVRDVERELMPAARAFGLGLLPYFPLASGLLTGKYKRGVAPQKGRLALVQRLADRYMTDGNWTIVERVDNFCAKRGVSMLEVAFSWLLARPTTASVIAGATTAEQVEQNVKAAALALSADDMGEIDRITKAA